MFKIFQVIEQYHVLYYIIIVLKCPKTVIGDLNLTIYVKYKVIVKFRLIMALFY